VFARGFKTWCENVAVLQRRRLRLRPTDPLNARVLARHLGVDVHTVDEVPGLDPRYLRILHHDDTDSWSAVTISGGTKDVVILNSAHAPTRLASDLMHELAHILIGHNPARIDVTEDGTLMLSTYNRQQEDEANWLAGCLLLPRDTLVLIRRQLLDLGTAARTYGTSLDMLNYRMNVTGIEYQFTRTTLRYGRLGKRA
jgi:IrrE N-terminal-like domain